MSEQTNHDALPLTEALLDGTIDDAGFARLEAILRDDAQARALHRSMVNLHAALPGILNQTPRLSIRLSDSDGESLLEPHEMPHAQLMDLLAQIEAKGEDLDPMVLATERFPAPQDDSPTKGDWMLAGRYVFEQAIHSRFVQMGAAAAVLLLSAVLFLTFGLPGDAVEPIASNDPNNQRPEEEAVRPVSAPVATLSAEHDARWKQDFDYGTPQPGDVFHAGRELTLLTGFAELVTVDNAVVLLEAPCTITFDEAGSALRLHTGKLVADVPEQAVGFTVHTPTARVIDYGTRFGVQVREDGSTNAAVFTGEVELSELPKAADQPTRNVRLTAGWSSQVSRNGILHREPKPVSPRDHSRFTKSLEEATSPGFAYRRAVLASEPVVYWGFDEGEDRTRNLAGQADHDGRAIGQTDHGEGLFGSALKLTGQIESMGGFVSDSPMLLTDAKAYTLEAWCWIDRPHHGRVLALAGLDEDLSVRPSHLGMLEVLGGSDVPAMLKQDQETIRFLHRNPPSFDSATGSNIFSKERARTGRWVHLVAVKDGQRARIYLNGEPVVASKDNQPIATDQPMDLYVGVSPIYLRNELSTQPSDFRPFAGRIDEVAVYDRTLSQETIRRHFSLGQSRVDD